MLPDTALPAIRKVLPAHWRAHTEPNGITTVHRSQCRCTLEIFPDGRVRTLHRHGHDLNMTPSGPFKEEAQLVTFMAQHVSAMNRRCG